MGTIVILCGVVLEVVRNSRFVPGLIILAGALCLVAFLLLNEANWSPPDS